IGTCSLATASGAPTWNRSAKQAPVITSASAIALASTSPSNPAQCQNGDPAAEVTNSYYAPNGLTTHSDFADLQRHVFFRTGTSFVGANFPVQNPPANATFGEFKVGIACGHPSPDVAALYIEDEQGNTSNVVCVSW
ncbi:MAG TPA: hypothetical protein VE782_07275, partial [Myxococcaceae bacterium]|nr:hypothetical protein [Myxococcaceae bacterium]